MKRREMLLATGAALGLSAFPLGWVVAQEKKHKILYFTRSAGFEHSPVHREGDQLSFSEKQMIEKGKKYEVEVVCTKDGSVFDNDETYRQFDAIAFYTSGDLTKPDKLNTPPMSAAGKQKLLDKIAAAEVGFVGFHSATDSFRTPPGEKDPYIAMIGGEFIGHGTQQKAPMLVASPSFPGAENLGGSFELLEEWYAFDKFADDLHVIFVQDTTKMSIENAADKRLYDRPPYPATWARMHGKGRVFYTSLGHREDVWTNPIFEQIVAGGFSWVMGDVDADVTPNIAKVTPKASQLRNEGT
ncbi:MAG: ThuA domain-containing protein [Pirellulales bacterium]|nr:ThuA domain-containing protein [Pirellulales bacterium]